MATLGALNGWLFIQGEFPMAAADDGLFPSGLCPAATGRASPWLGIAAFVCALACAVLLLKFSDSLVETFTFMMTLVHALGIGALSPCLGWPCGRLLRGDVSEAGMGAVSLGVVTVAFCAWVIFGCGREVLLYGGLLLRLFGLACSTAARTSHPNPPHDTIPHRS